jgi:cell division septation protein DedD
MFRAGAAALVTCAAFCPDIGGDAVMKVSAVTRAVLLSVVALTLVAGCSRERIDWKSAESADTLQAYDHFIERHPDSALATQARARMAQLVEDRDWQRASTTDTAEAYKQFLAQHANGKWAEEARIRIENFTLETNPSPLAAAASDNEASARQATTAGETQAGTPGAMRSGTARPGEPASAESPPRVSPPPPGPPSKPAPVAQAAAAPASSSGASAAAKPGSAPPPSQRATNSTAAADSSSFGIQLGAFGTQAAALGAWKRLQVSFDHELHGLFAHAVPVRSTSGQLFRLQAPVGDESRARGICAALAKQSQPCVVVLPQPH